MSPSLHRGWAAPSVVAFLAFLILLCAAALGVTELALQTMYARELYQSSRRHPPNPFLQVTPSAPVDHINAQGFRGDEIASPRLPGTFRVFAVGGSITLGVTNPYADSYPFLLQTLLRERHPGASIEVMNAGSSWYTSAHDLVAYEIEVRRFVPDVVIYFEAINDLSRSFSPPWWATGDYKADYSHYLGPYVRMTGPEAQFFNAPTSWLTLNYLHRWLTSAPAPFDHHDVAKIAARLRPIDEPTFRSLTNCREYEDALIRAVQSDGHTIIVGSQPSLYRTSLEPDEQRPLYFAPVMCADNGTYPSLAAMVRGMQMYNAATQEVAAARQAPFVDFDAAVPKTLTYFSDDVHLTRMANVILAKQAADTIDRLRLVEAARDGGPR